LNKHLNADNADKTVDAKTTFHDRETEGTALPSAATKEFTAEKIDYVFVSFPGWSPGTRTKKPPTTQCRHLSADDSL